MFWKILLGIGLLLLLASVIFIIIGLRAFYAATDPNVEDVAFAGFLLSVLVLIVSFLISALSLIFVLKNSKKAWDAENAK